jgi:hypothetical protein
MAHELIEQAAVDLVAAVGGTGPPARCSIDFSARSKSALVMSSPLTRASTSGSCAGTGFGGAGVAAGAGGRALAVLVEAERSSARLRRGALASDEAHAPHRHRTRLTRDNAGNSGLTCGKVVARVRRSACYTQRSVRLAGNAQAGRLVAWNG